MGYVPPSLQVLDLKNNQIYRLTDIGKASSHLHILDLENNFINKEQFSDLLVYLE
jgi:Leucine-rich repeat (LRR) protein